MVFVCISDFRTASDNNSSMSIWTEVRLIMERSRDYEITFSFINLFIHYRVEQWEHTEENGFISRLYGGIEGVILMRRDWFQNNTSNMYGARQEMNRFVFFRTCP